MCIYIWNLVWEVCVNSKVKMYICGVSMRRPVKVFRFTFLYLFFYVICIGYNISYASSPDVISTIKIPKWSLEFNDCSVSDALDQISRFTGVNVFTNKGVDKRILKKYYNDKTIDYIVTDILSRENYAMIRRFSDKKKLVSIGIWILDWSDERSNLRPASFRSKRGVKHGDSVTTNNPFEASRIERNVKNSKNPFAKAATKNAFKANRTEGKVKDSNKNNPFVNAATKNPFEANYNQP